MSQTIMPAVTIEQLYHERHQPPRRYLARLVSDRAMAEDLCHETFVKALRHWGDCDQAARAVGSTGSPPTRPTIISGGSAEW